MKNVRKVPTGGVDPKGTETTNYTVKSSTDNLNVSETIPPAMVYAIEACMDADGKVKDFVPAAVFRLSEDELYRNISVATTFQGKRRAQILQVLEDNHPEYAKTFSRFIADRRRADAIEYENRRKQEHEEGSLDAKKDPLATWKWRTLKDAYSPRPPMTYVVDGLLSYPSLDIMYAPPGAYKSMLMADIVACVVQGKPWLGHETTKVPCIWIDIDNGQRRVDDRFNTVGKGHSVPVDAPIYYTSMAMPLLDASNPMHIESLKTKIIELGAKLVVIDNLVSTSGGIDENTAEMMAPMTHWRLLSEQTGACIVIIHHRNKSKDMNRAGDALRGFSGIEGSIDLALYVQRADVHAKTVIVKSTKTRDKDVEPFAAKFEYIDDETGTTTAAWFEPASMDEAGASAVRTTSARAAVLRILERDGEHSQARLAEKTRKAIEASGATMGRDSIYDLIHMMEEDEEIYSYERGKARIYTLQKRLGSGPEIETETIYPDGRREAGTHL